MLRASFLMLFLQHSVDSASELPSPGGVVFGIFIDVNEPYLPILYVILCLQQSSGRLKQDYGKLCFRPKGQQIWCYSHHPPTVHQILDHHS